MKKLDGKFTILLLFLFLMVVLAVRFSYALQLNVTSDVYEIIDNTIIVTPTLKSVKTSEIKSKINFVTDVDIYNTNNKKMNDDDYVGTGFKLKAASTYYNIVVLGDTTGDGIINLGDVSKLYNHFKYGNTLSDDYLESGKITRNDTITLGDVSKLYNFYKGNATLEYYNKNIKLTDYDNLNVNLNNPSSGDSITRTFSVKNNGSSTEEYNIYLSEIINNFNDKTDLVYTLESTNGCSSEERAAPSITGNESKIVSSCSIPKNTTHTYTLKILFEEDVMSQEDNTNVSFSAKISLNNFQKTNIDSESIIVETVNDLKSKDIAVGQHAVTLGYYSSLDGGNGYYVIEAKSSQKIDNGRFIELNNGNVAKLIPENKTITVKQFGAYGDSEHDDSDYIQTAFNALDNNEINTVYFSEGLYKTTKTIIMKSGNYIGHENSKIVITNFNSNKEYAFGNINKNDDISTIHIYSLNFEVDVQEKYTTYVLRFGNTINSSIKNTHSKTASTNTSGVTFIDLYNSNNYFNILSSSSYIKTDDNRLNTHIQIRANYSSKNSNINVNGFVGEKNGADESIWLDGWYGTIKNVDIANCTFKVSGNNMNDIYLGTTHSEATLENVNFHDSTIIRDNYKYKIVSIAANGESATNNHAGTNKNIKFYNNTIKINSISSSELSTGGTIIQLGQRDASAEYNENISVENNTIIAENAKIGSVIKNVSTDYFGVVRNNTIKVNGFTSNFIGIYVGLELVDGGTLSKTDGSPIGVKNVFRNCSNVQNITANIKGDLVNDYKFTGEATYKNLNITCTGKVFNFTGESTNPPTYNIVDSTFNNTDNSLGVWYTDLNSGTSNDNKVTFNITNTTFTNNNKYGSMVINNN